MAQAYVQQRAQGAVWSIVNGGTAASIYPSTAIPLVWDDGTAETVPARIYAAAVGGAISVDLTQQTYIVVTTKGAGGALTLVPESSLATMDAIMGANWAILRRVLRTHTVDWQEG